MKKQKQCPSVVGLGHPVQIFHTYFKQTMSVFNPKNRKTRIKLIYYREELEESSYHYFVFKIKNTYANKFDYVGIVSTVPPGERARGTNTHYVLRYVNTKEADDIAVLLGIFNLNENAEMRCLNSKKTWINYMRQNPYVLGLKENRHGNNFDTRVEQKLVFSSLLTLGKNLLEAFDLNVGYDDLKFNDEVLDVFEFAFQNVPYILVSSNLYRNFNKTYD
jgi:hypothetical protein